MADKRITDFALSTGLGTALTTIVDSPGAGPVNKKITLLNLITYGMQNVAIQIFTSNDTYTPTTGMKKCLAIVVGGGGGGCTAISTDAAGGGGGGGGTAIKLITAAEIGVSKAVTVGIEAAADGTGATNSLGTIISATGGAPGVETGGFVSVLSSAGGVGGIGSGGDLNIKGSDGNRGIIFSGTYGMGGNGGSSMFGGGGLGGAANTVGSAGNIYGGGGGGGHASGSPNRAGGAGAVGLVYIIEFL